LNNKIFVINQDNRILCLDSTDGSVIWDVATIQTFIKSQNLLGLAITKNENLIALNTAGDVLKINGKNGHIIWFMNSLTSTSEHETDFFKSSDIVVRGNDVVFSSVSSTFSLNLNNGYINWMAKPRSSNTPIIAGNNIFLVTDGGFFVNLDRTTGKIVFSTNILKVLKKKARRTGISGYVMGSGKIYITTLNGHLIVCSSTGKVESYKKIAKSINTSPIISNGELYILTSKSKILGFK
jgi:outer membrane protein assembly factor BamB